MRKLSFAVEKRPLRNPYTYARSTEIEQELVVVHIEQSGKQGRGECSPYSSFFGRPSTETLQAIRDAQSMVERGASREALLESMAPGPARCAIDCALWDLEAALSGKPAWVLAGREAPRDVKIAYTISLDDLQTVRETAMRAKHLPVLKIKGGAPDDGERVRIVRGEAPDARLTIDPNGAWDARQLEQMFPILEECGIEMLEQPVQRGADSLLQGFRGSIPIFADESFSDMRDMEIAAQYYDGINIKLDKCGGLTAGYSIVDHAREAGLRVMIGCLGGTSLSAAPGMLIAALADFVDLDSQLWHLNDREQSLPYENGILGVGNLAGWGLGEQS
jgi:L-Ala-D/L-Glu epimerase